MNELQILRDAFLKRQTKNPAYTTRAFARDLGVSQAFISLVLNGKRKISSKMALQFSQALKMSNSETERFLKTVSFGLAGAQNLQAENALQLQVDRFKVISDWYHLAILDITALKQFKPEPSWIAKKLGITQLQVKDAVERLTRLGLLEIRAGKWTKAQRMLAVPTEYSDEAVRSFHRQMIEKASKTLDETDQTSFEARQISGTTMTVNMKRLPEAKRMMVEFQRKLTAFLTEGDCTELYQFNLQLFSLTKRGDV